MISLEENAEIGYSPRAGEVAEWFKAPVLKTGGPQGPVSSNLTLSAIKNPQQRVVFLWRYLLVKIRTLLKKIRTANFERFAPPPLAVPQKSFLNNFLFFRARFFPHKRKRKLFCWHLLRTSRVAGLAAIFIRSGMAEGGCWWEFRPPSPVSSIRIFSNRHNQRPPS